MNKKIIKAQDGTNEWWNVFPYDFNAQSVTEKLQPNGYIYPVRINQKQSGLPLGVTDITEHVSQGNLKYHPKYTKEKYFDGTVKDKGIYFRDPQTGSIYYDEIVSNKLQPELNLKDFEILSREQIAQMYPKRDYIGGTPKEVRMKVLDKIPWVKDYIQNLSTIYNIDPNVLLHRFTKEGYLDHLAQEYNSDITTAEQSDYFDYVTNGRVSGFYDIGLDDFGTNYNSGTYNLRRDIPFELIEHQNEKGRTILSADFNNLKDALEAKAADLEYRTKLAKTRGISEEELPAYVNAMYNLGVNHNDLKNSQYILETYGVPLYFKSGGIISNYLKKFNYVGPIK